MLPSNLYFLKRYVPTGERVSGSIVMGGLLVPSGEIVIDL